MTQREELIAKYQQWLDTNPRKELIACQCANIAEEYANELEKFFTSEKDSFAIGFANWICKHIKENTYTQFNGKSNEEILEIYKTELLKLS